MSDAGSKADTANYCFAFETKKDGEGNGIHISFEAFRKEIGKYEPVSVFLTPYHAEKLLRGMQEAVAHLRIKEMKEMKEKESK